LVAVRVEFFLVIFQEARCAVIEISPTRWILTLVKDCVAMSVEIGDNRAGDIPQQRRIFSQDLVKLQGGAQAEVAGGVRVVVLGDLSICGVHARQFGRKRARDNQLDLVAPFQFGTPLLSASLEVQRSDDTKAVALSEVCIFRA
jgi:hypothetical protein